MLTSSKMSTFLTTKNANEKITIHKISDESSRPTNLTLFCRKVGSIWKKKKNRFLFLVFSFRIMKSDIFKDVRHF